MGPVIWLDLWIETRGRALLGVELWAETRRLKRVEGLSQREIHRRTGVHRDTIRRALASNEPPSYGPRAKRPSKLDPFMPTICELLDEEPTLSGVRILEETTELGYAGGKTSLDDRLDRAAGPTDRALPRLLRPAVSRLDRPRRRRLPGQGSAR